MVLSAGVATTAAAAARGAGARGAAAAAAAPAPAAAAARTATTVITEGVAEHRAGAVARVSLSEKRRALQAIIVEAAGLWMCVLLWCMCWVCVLRLASLTLLGMMFMCTHSHAHASSYTHIFMPSHVHLCTCTSTCAFMHPLMRPSHTFAQDTGRKTQAADSLLNRMREPLRWHI